MVELTGEMPAPEEIRAQVDRMIGSVEFARSPQLGALLRFLVESVLLGRSNRIKAYTIGVEVLRRDAKFDPQLDPIVRVEATRLRRTIDRYYAGSGTDDTIRIDIPRGSYVPTFRQRSIVPGSQTNALPAALWPEHWLFNLRPLSLVIAATIAVIAIISVILLRIESTPKFAAKGVAGAVQSPTIAGALPPGNGMPIVVISNFEAKGTSGTHSISARSLRDRLSDGFSHFDLVNIFLQPEDSQLAISGPATPPNDRADYRFVGLVEYSEDGSARLLFRLIDNADDSIVWSRVFDGVPADDQSSVEDMIVRQLAGTLLQPFGVIYAHQRQKVLAGTVTDPRYRCLVEVIDSFRTFDAAQHSRGRDCLDQLTARDPNFALGFTYLAAMDLRDFQYDFDQHAGDVSPLERGLSAARRGVELQPESSRAYEMLFVILFARRNLTAAFDAANKAITLNRYDMRSLGAYGARLIASGDIEKGLAMLRQAGDDGIVRPPFEEFFLFLGNYLRNDLSDATFHADQLTGEDFQLGLIARALVATAKDDRSTAAQALARLVVLNPVWRDDLRGTLEKFFFAPAIIDRLVSDLARAGLTKRL